MFAFLRVIVFYLGFAALLTWAIFALGWADALELPGFEGAQPPVATAPVREPGVEPQPKLSQSRDAKPEEPPAKRVSEPETKRLAERPAAPAEQRPPQPLPPVAAAPVQAPREPTPLPRVEVATALPPVAESPRLSEAPKVTAPAPLPPREAKATDAVAVAPPLPQAKATLPAPLPAPRAADAAPPLPPARAADPAPMPPPAVRPAPATQAAPVATAAPSATAPSSRGRWSPQRRIAGFDADALVDVLEDTKRPPDDVPCVMFRGLAFKAGSTVSQPWSRDEVETVAKILSAIPGSRVEIGSRLGPGRPMVSDAKLRTDRATIVRQRLIELGVPSERLMIDANESYERVSEDVTRARGGRVQSIGLCVHST